MANRSTSTSTSTLLVLLLPLLAACPGSLGFTYVPSTADTGSGGMEGGGGMLGSDASIAVDGADGPIPAGCADAARIIQANCASCHTSPPSPIYANLDLTSAGVASRLVGKPAYTGASGECGGMGNLLDPVRLPATGILIDKINFSPTVCGSGMPYTPAAPLSATDVACLQAWANGLVAVVGTN
jgi:hypothetical protein